MQWCLPPWPARPDPALHSRRCLELRRLGHGLQVGSRQPCHQLWECADRRWSRQIRVPVCMARPGPATAPQPWMVDPHGAAFPPPLPERAPLQAAGCRCQLRSKRTAASQCRGSDAADATALALLLRGGAAVSRRLNKPFPSRSAIGQHMPKPGLGQSWQIQHRVLILWAWGFQRRFRPRTATWPDPSADENTALACRAQIGDGTACTLQAVLPCRLRIRCATGAARPRRCIQAGWIQSLNGPWLDPSGSPL